MLNTKKVRVFRPDFFIPDRVDYYSVPFSAALIMFSLAEM